jgi:hypothetical protein
VPGAESLPVSRLLSRVGLTIKITSDSSLSVLRVASCHGGGAGLGQLGCGRRIWSQEQGSRDLAPKLQVSAASEPLPPPLTTARQTGLHLVHLLGFCNYERKDLSFRE